MKKLYTLLVLVITTITFAQAPQGFNYQATVRNSAGALIVNQNVFFKFNLMLNSASSLPVFSETHMTPTDDLGQVNLVIGTGTATVGTFSTINWGTGNYYLGIELNTGSGYVAMGTTQLLSVPYALYANSSGNTQAATPNLASVLAENNGANNLQIKNLADPTDAQDAVTKSYLETQIASLQNQINNLQNLSVTPSVNQQVICTGNSTQVGLSSNQLGATFTWTASVLSVPTDGTINGFSSGTGNEIAQILVNTGSSAGIVRYIVTPQIGLISGQPISIDITVNPIPVISGGQNFQFCYNNFAIGTSLFISNDDIVPVGTTYTWTSIGGSSMDTPQSDIYDYQMEFYDFMSFVQYTITPHFSGCVGTPFTVSVNYFPVPSIDDINVNINSGDTINLTPTNGGGINNSDVVPPNTIYSWANNNASIGLGAAGTGADLIFTLTNSGTTPMVTQIIVIPSTVLCQGESFTITLTINPSIVAPLPNVIIGTQIWSSTNLDVTTYRDGTPIPQVTDPTQWANLTTGAWCYYNNDPANGTIYGKLYNWYAVAGIHDNDPATPNKILAPIGWHIPSHAEWTSLTTFLGGESLAGGKMKSTGTSLWQSPNTAATNESGFTAFPGGFCSNLGSYLNISSYGMWWSSSILNTYSAFRYHLTWLNGYATNNDGSDKNEGYSVRCIKD